MALRWRVAAHGRWLRDAKMHEEIVTAPVSPVDT